MKKKLCCIVNPVKCSSCEWKSTHCESHQPAHTSYVVLTKREPTTNKWGPRRIYCPECQHGMAYVSP